MKKLFPHNQKAYEAVMTAFATQDRAAVVHATGTGKTYISAAVVGHFEKVLIVAPVAFILDEHRKLNNNNVTYVTYTKLLLNYEACGNGYDLIVLDEFHRCGAESWGEAVNGLLEDNPQAKVLGLTATNKRYLEGRDMAEEMFKDSVVSVLSLKDAILQKILKAPKCIIGYYTFGVTYKKYQERIEDSNASQEVKAEALRKLDGIKLNWSKAYNVHNLLKKHMPEYAKRVIIFCSNHEILNSCKKDVKKWFADAGFKIYKMYHVNSDEETISRKNMEEFQVSGYDGIKIMFAVDMLNEGVHVPNVDAVIMLRKTISKNVYLQQIGRCLDADARNRAVIFDLVANATRATDLQEWREIKAAYDRNELDHGRGFGKDNSSDFVIEDYTMEMQTFLDNVDNMLPHAFDLWDKRKPLIDAHYAKYGHLPTMEEDRELHIYIMSFKYGTRDNDIVREKAAMRRQKIREYLMTLGFDPNVTFKTKMETLYEVKAATEERGYYTNEESYLIKRNRHDNESEYSAILEDFIATHYSELEYFNIQLLKEVLPTIDWLKKYITYTEIQTKTVRLVKNVMKRNLKTVSERFYCEADELIAKNPIVPLNEVTKRRLIKFITEKERLPQNFDSKTNKRADLTEEQLYESQLKNDMYRFIREQDPDIVALYEKYKKDVKTPEEAMLDILEDFVKKEKKYPNNTNGTLKEKALARRVTTMRKRLNAEQMERFEKILEGIETPEKKKLAAEAKRLELIAEIIRVTKAQGCTPCNSTYIGKYMQWHKNDPELAEIKDFPTYREYVKTHKEIKAAEKVLPFIEKKHRLPDARISLETYTARCIKNYIWYTPIYEAVLPYADSAPSFLYDTIQEEIRKRN